MATSTQQAGGYAAERRAHRRFRMNAEVRYEAAFEGRIAQSGRGTLADISRTGLLLRCDRSLAAGMDIELTTPWPAQLSGAGMKLFIVGRTVRAAEECVGVRILRYDFRIERPPAAGPQS